MTVGRMVNMFFVFFPLFIIIFQMKKIRTVKISHRKFEQEIKKRLKKERTSFTRLSSFGYSSKQSGRQQPST